MKAAMKILITGGTGQVGFELRRSLAALGRISAPTRLQLDLYDSHAVVRYLNDLQPDLIVNAAAYTAVDKAETETDQAQRLNAALPAQLAKYASLNHIWLVHYSSDYVYPGEGSTAYTEDATTGPLGVYGQSKLAGDNAIIASGANHLIFRTSWVYSARGNNFMKTMLRLGREREQLAVVGDQIGAPTPARLIADITALALAGAQTAGESKLHPGIYHLSPRGETSWHGFAQAIFMQATAQGATFAITPEQVNAITSADYPTPAQRPKNSRLQLMKLEQALSIQLPSWDSQLALTLEEYLTVTQ